MASTFHTPSFGDEDFNIPSLALPSSDGSTGLYSSGTPPTSDFSNQAPSSGPHLVTSSSASSHLQGHQISGHQGQGHFSPSFPVQNGFHGYPEGTPQGYNFLPKFPPQTFDIPDIQASNSLGVNQLKNSNLITTTTVMATSQAMVLEMPENSHQAPGMPPAHPATRSQSASQISPPTSNTTSPGRESSAEESSSDDSVPLAQLAQKRNAPVVQPKPTAAKKPRTPKKRKKKDPNEPQKPVSAYALFFRDTQAAIKTRNPNASFGEVSKIVASMWDGLDEDNKNDYKKRTEAAKKEYLKQLAAYRATLVSKGALESSETRNNSSPKQQQQHSSPSRQPILPNPAMTTVPMTTHPMTSSMSMPGMPLSHMPPSAPMTHNPGHMVSPPHQQHYGMLPPPGNHMVAPPMGMIPPPGAMSPDTLVASPPEALGMHDGYMGTPVVPGSPPMAMDSPTASMCVRNGCGNPAIQNHGWDNEYCSNDCVVNHCRDAFTQWVSSRQGPGPYASVK